MRLVYSKLAESFKNFMEQKYKEGFKEGQNGLPYSGSTFIGYYGWLDGTDEHQKGE